MKKQAVQALSVVSGAAVLLAGCAAPAPETRSAAAPAVQEIAAVQTEHGVLELAEASVYDELASVKGTFSFDQNVLSPADEIFNLFGTAATALCAKPGFAFDRVEAENYYINVGGKLKKNYTVSLADLKKQGGVTRSMLCSCATGSPVAQANVTGALVSDLLSLAEVEEDANTITFRAADGYSKSMPLSYVLEKGAMVVWQVAGEENPCGAQIWMPDTVARYFTRQVTEIEVSREEDVPQVEGADAAQRAKVSILNRSEEVFSVGDQITFSGYADDCGTAIAAVEFSLDGGKHWTTCGVKDARADKWVCWSLDYTAENAGTFKLDVRARTAEGTVSPLASSVVFTVR